MISLRPLSKRDFFRHLFLQSSFDNLLLTDLSLRTDILLEIDGRLPAPGPTDDGPAVPALQEPCRSWGSLRPRISAFLAGGEPLRSLRLVLMLSRVKTEEFLRIHRSELSPEEVEGFFLNILFAKDSLTLTTGCSLRKFSFDKGPERAWDRQIEQLLEQLEIKTGEAP